MENSSDRRLFLITSLGDLAYRIQVCMLINCILYVVAINLTGSQRSPRMYVNYVITDHEVGRGISVPRPRNRVLGITDVPDKVQSVDNHRRPNQLREYSSIKQ
jgi:hypothetical protein